MQRVVKTQRRTPGGTVLSGLAASLLEISLLKRSELDELLARHELTVEQISDPRARLPLKSVVSLWDELCLLSPGVPIALHAAAQGRVGAFGSLEYLVRNRATVRQAILAFCESYRLVNDVVHWSYSEEPGGNGRVIYSFPADSFGYSRIGSEAVFAWIVEVGRERSRTEWTPLEVAFQHLPQGDIAHYTWFFGCTVRFGAPKSELRLSREVLELPFVGSDAALGQLLRQQVERDLEEIPGMHDFAGHVLKQIERALRKGRAPSLENCATELRRGPRDLQRRLEEQGTTYSRLLDQARREACAAHLLDSRKSIFEISDLLGFSEPSAFIRAFKRWHGSTPRRFRESCSMSP